MRTISLVVDSFGAVTPNDISVGSQGEHNVSTLVFKPDAKILSGVGYFRVALGDYLSEQIYAKNQEIAYSLPQCVMLNSPLLIQLEGYSVNDSGEVLRVFKSDIITAKVKHSIEPTHEVSDQVIAGAEGALAELAHYVDNGNILAASISNMVEQCTEILKTTEKTLADKADKSNLLAGYGIEDAYTKNETDAKLDKKADKRTTLAGYGITDAFTQGETRELVNYYYDMIVNDTYTKPETNELLNQKLNISDLPTKISHFSNDKGYLLAKDIKNKADKSTTLAGYGITDTYTKTELREILPTELKENAISLANLEVSLNKTGYSSGGQIQFNYMSIPYNDISSEWSNFYAGGTYRVTLKRTFSKNPTTMLIYMADPDPYVTTIPYESEYTYNVAQKDDFLVCDFTLPSTFRDYGTNLYFMFPTDDEEFSALKTIPYKLEKIYTTKVLSDLNPILNSKADNSAIPTKVSQLENDSGYLVVDDIKGKADKNKILDYITYQIVNGSVTITDCDTSISGTHIIPEIIEGYPVTVIGNEAFFKCSGLVSITIPNSVIDIGDGAFWGCAALESLVIPDGITIIKSGSIPGKYLKKLYLPDSILTIEDGIFPDPVDELYSIDVYYNGTREQWSKVQITGLANEGYGSCVTLHYKYDDVPMPIKNSDAASKKYVDESLENKRLSFANGDTITLADNTTYYAENPINTLTIVYPQTDFIASVEFTLASEGDITITLPESKYIGGAPTFANSETWELNIKNKVVVGGLVE